MSTHHRALAAALAASSATLFAATTHAQYAAPPPVVGAQPEVVQPQPVVAPPQQRGGRFRAGLEVGVGWAFDGPLSGLGVVGAFRLGWQFNDYLAAYIQHDLPVAFVSGPALYAHEYAGPTIAAGTSLMGELTLANILSIGVGPSVDYIATRPCWIYLATECLGTPNAAFGVQGRVAVTIAGSVRGEARRRGLRLGVSSHTVFAQHTFQAVNLTVGYEWY